ncbi:hypothetical protein OsI_33195 [Oryza sativa Indica Group]|uniref:Uncharacterized protein n=1 Tax=Oryza sativa subsp. indica TaxID=39946 RepID=A2Z6B3_ORYSI|nr:hypothetical protein OsI_33195 [Oryza sativa Indica Group]
MLRHNPQELVNYLGLRDWGLSVANDVMMQLSRRENSSTVELDEVVLPLQLLRLGLPHVIDLALIPNVYRSYLIPLWREFCETLESLELIEASQVNLGPADRVPYLYYEAAKTTVAEAEQTASLMAIHALATERQIEIRDVNYPQVQHLRHQVARLRGRVVEAEKLCAELLTIVRSSENEVMFLERLTHRLYHRVRYLSETITVLQRGGGGSDSSSGSV